MNPVDSTWLTIALEKILVVFGQGQHRIQGIAADLLVHLAILELTVVLLWATLDGGAQLSGIIKRIIFISLVYWGITNYDTVITGLVDSFVKVGEIAGSSDTSSTLSVNDPGGIFLRGIELTRPWSETTGKSFWRWGISDIWRTFFWFVIVIAFGLLAIQVWLTRLEFGVLSCLGLIFLPLSVWKHGKWIAEKILGAYVAVAGKLMALAFIISVIAPVLKDFQVSANGTFEDEANVVVAVFALLLLAWKAPNMIMAFLSGGAVIGLSSISAIPRTGEFVAGSAGFAGSVYGGGANAYNRIKSFAGDSGSSHSSGGSSSSTQGGSGTATTKTASSSTNSNFGTGGPVDMTGFSSEIKNGGGRLRSSSLAEEPGTQEDVVPPKIKLKPSYNDLGSAVAAQTENNSNSNINSKQDPNASLDTSLGTSQGPTAPKRKRTRKSSLARLKHSLSDDSEIDGNIIIPIRTEND